MEQKRERQHTDSQPTDSKQSTLLFVSVANTIHFDLLSVSFFLGSFSRPFKGFVSWSSFASRLSHRLSRARFNSLSFCVYVCVQSFLSHYFFFFVFLASLANFFKTLDCFLCILDALVNSLETFLILFNISTYALIALFLS